MSNTRIQQTVIIGAIVLLLVFLFTRDIKGLIAPAKDPAATEAQAPAPALNIEEASTIAKNMISTGLSRGIVELEQAYKSAGDKEKLKLAEQLAQQWEDVGQLIPSALYLDIVAQKERTLDLWVKSGDRFLKAYDSTLDTAVIQPALLQKANEAFTAALAIDSSNLAAKTGMGITIVNSGAAPMQGILMLLDVVKKDPQNYNANMQLGMFAVKSGQFDKAVTRFKHVVSIKETSEAYFFLATALESLNNKQEAIEAYLQSKRIAANPNFSKYVDSKVAELKK